MYFNDKGINVIRVYLSSRRINSRASCQRANLIVIYSVHPVYSVLTTLFNTVIYICEMCYKIMAQQIRLVIILKRLLYVSAVLCNSITAQHFKEFPSFCTLKLWCNNIIKHDWHLCVCINNFISTIITQFTTMVQYIRCRKSWNPFVASLHSPPSTRHAYTCVLPAQVVFFSRKNRIMIPVWREPKRFIPKISLDLLENVKRKDMLMHQI